MANLSLGVIIQVVKDQLTAWTEQAKERLTRLSGAGKGAGDAISAGQDKAATSAKKLSAGLESISGQLRTLQGLAVSYGAFSKLATAVGDVVKLADSMKLLDARLKNASGSSAAAAQALADIRRVANETGQPIEAVAEVFTRITRATKALGVTQAEVAGVTETLSKSMAANGEAGASAEAAMLQLGQAFASGVFRGEELNSVMEQTPSVAKLIADGLGVTIGRLREMGQAGELTAEKVFRAIQSQKKAVEDAFGGMPDTIGKSLERINNEWAIFIANLDKSTGASTAAAQALESVNTNFNQLVGLAKDAAVLGLVAAFAKAAISIKTYGTQLLAAGAAGVALRTATVQVAAATAEAAKMDALAATAAMRKAEAHLAAAAAARAEAVATEQAAAAAAIYGPARANAARVAAAAAAAETAAAATVGAAATQAAAKTSALAAASAAATAAVSRQGGRLTAVFSGLRGVMARIPGLVKIAVVWFGAEAAINHGSKLLKQLAELKVFGKDYEEQQKRNEKRWREEAAAAEQAAVDFERYKNVRILASEEIARLGKEERAAYLESINGARVFYAESLRAAIAQEGFGKATKDAQDVARAGLEKTADALTAFAKASAVSENAVKRLLSIGATQLIDDFQKLRKEGDSTADAMKGMFKAFDPGNLGAVRDFGQALGELFLKNEISARDFEEAWKKALSGLDGQQLVVFRTVAEAAFGDTERDVASLGQAIDTSLKQALQGLGYDADKAFGGVSKNAKDAIANLDVLIGGMDRLKEKGVKVDEVFSEAFKVAIKTADSVQALELIGQRLDLVGEKSGLAKNRVAELRKELGERIAELTPGIQTLAEAFEKLGIKSQESLQKSATEARQAYESVRALGGSLEEQKAAWLAYAEKAVEANRGVAATGLKAEAAVLGLEKELAKIEGSSDRARAAADELRAAWDQQARIGERATEAVRQHGTAMVAAAQQALEAAKAIGDSLAIEEATVQVREAEAKAAWDLAAALQAEADAARANVAALLEKAQADGIVTEAEQQLLDTVQRTTEELQKQADAAKQAAQGASAAATAATEKKDEVRTASIDWESLAGKYGLAGSRADELAAAQAKVWAGMQRMYSTGFGGLDGYIDAMNAATERAAGFVKALSRVEEAASGGDEALGDYVAALRSAIRMGSIMGNEEMAPLRAALRDAKQRIKDLGDSARDTLNSLRDELDEMNKNYDEIERRRSEARRAEIEAQLAIAKSAGNTAAVADLTNALRLLREVSTARIQEARAREQEDARTLKGGSSGGLTEAQTQDRVVVKVVDLNIKVGDVTGTAQVVEGGEEVIVDMLRKAQMVAS